MTTWGGGNDINLNFTDEVNTKLEQIEKNTENLNNKVDKIQATTSGGKVATGRIIDGKTEYLERINLGYLPNATETKYSLNIPTTQFVTGFKLYGSSASDEYIPIPRTVGSGQQINYYINQENNILILHVLPTMNISRFTGYMEICYIEK